MFKNSKIRSLLIIIVTACLNNSAVQAQRDEAGMINQEYLTKEEPGKIALITGITGQDGAYLAEFLLKKGYTVHGIKRPASSFNTTRIDNLIGETAQHPMYPFYLHYGDMTDGTNLARIIQEVQPDEIYNLAAQSHVKRSFDMAEYTANTDALGTLRILEAIRMLNMTKKIKFYQASTSELYGGDIWEAPQSETTPFYPRSPYAVAKLYAYWITVNYREAYNMFAVNGILFNHESPLRGETFVTRKITRAVARIYHNLQEVLYLGNLDAKRDWGYAKEYVEAMWLMLQHSEPHDFVIATGQTHTVKEFVERSFEHIGISLIWVGEGIDEKGYNAQNGKLLVAIDPRYFRPTEVNLLIGNADKAYQLLGWKSKTTFKELVDIMVDADMELVKNELSDNENHYGIDMSHNLARMIQH